MRHDELKIGELAVQTGYTVEAIRYYEREGLLPAPARSGGNYRIYRGVHLERLQFIRHCRSLDMALDEIRSLLTFRDQPDQSCGDVNALLDKHIIEVADRIAQLKSFNNSCLDCGDFAPRSRRRRIAPSCSVWASTKPQLAG